MKFETALFLLLFGAFLYPVIMRLLLKKTHHTRLRMIEIGNELLSSDRISDSQKKMIRSSMRASFSWWPMALVVFIMPFYLLKNGLTKNVVRIPNDPDLERKYALFQECQGKSLMVANPIFSIIAILEVSVYLMIKGMPRSSEKKTKVAYKSVSFSFLSFEKRRFAHSV
jgi:hypothetical protein